MGYRNVYYDPRGEAIHLWTWDENGQRIKIVNSFEPYIYIESTNGTDGVSIFNTPLKKVKFRNQFERSKFLNETTIKRVFYNLNCEQQYLLDTYKNTSENSDFSKNKLKIFYFDIETYGKNGFASPKDATDPINLITVYDSIDEKYYTWGLKKDYISKNPDEIYIKCHNEESLLKKFLDFWQKDPPDCITGWNISGYDIPYIINRITIILGEEEARKLSPVQRLYFREREGRLW
jgi:DNA polymerase elongation subunit (family B)